MITLLSIALIVLTGAVVYLIYRLFHSSADSDSSRLMMQYLEGLKQETQNRLDKIDGRIHNSLQSTQENSQKQFSENSKLIKEIFTELSKVKETNSQVLNFSEKLQSLENILRNPKQRGILGEYFLETLLSNVFQPSQYQVQYTFNNGEKVDAVVFVRDQIIPIDAKFSLEKYNLIIEEQDSVRRAKLEKDFISDVKNRIDETSKYIRPNEGTTDFAFMFIPAEGIYYSLLAYKVGELKSVSTDLIEYAFKKHVIIVSPTSFFAYLETVMHGLKALEIENSVKDIIKKLGDLATHLKRYDEQFSKLGDNLGKTVSAYNNTYKEFNKIDKDILRITGERIKGDSINLIDKPQIHE